MVYVFGPVPSRRLGLSLGVDLIPRKTCTFDCLYCEVGRTTQKTIRPSEFYPAWEINQQVAEYLKSCSPDTITLAGSGEPTLNSAISEIIYSIREITDIPIAVLTNGSLFWIQEIRKRVTNADIILPTLSTGREEVFKTIHRPHPQLRLEDIITGLEKLREEYTGKIYLEVVLLKGINDGDLDIEILKQQIDRIRPDRIQLNTVVRPPADIMAKPLDMERLEEIKRFLGDKAEIISSAIAGKGGARTDTVVEKFLEMIKRRPLREVDLVAALDLPLKEIQGLIKGLLIKGIIRSYEHLGSTFYLLNQENRSEERK